ncbi:hypothetical protein ABE288_09920 [Bacillus salipaludis]|uniref:hypothetical protein n=1 Tax=Bacillus salipaludis TaxID=2547811 RepID=UPI003D240105
MFHLMRLELNKTKLGWFVKGAIIANISILGLLCIVSVVEKSEGTEMLKDVTSIFTISGACVKGVFIVFATVLISKMIIHEFKNRTIDFGMRKYSTPATIISSLLIVSVICQSIGPNFSLASIIYIPLALALIALGIVVLAIRNINHIDLD